MKDGETPKHQDSDLGQPAGKKRRGRPKGYPKTGGRKKGSLNKTTLAARQMDEQTLIAYGMSNTKAKDFARLSPKVRIKTYISILPYLL